MAKDPSWLPPDQIATRKFPVVGERAPLTPDWSLELTGRVAAPKSWAIPELIAQADQQLTMDVHCVTRWSHRQMTFTGLPLAALIPAGAASPDARFVRFVACSARAHDTSLPLDYALKHCWIVHAVDDMPLTEPHGGPLRVVTPGRYFYKSLKWLQHIELLADDRLGYWERTDGYHNAADPWPGDQRYISGSVEPERLARFRAATDFKRWHNKTLRSADLRGWVPKSRTLGPLSLKGCDLRGAVLKGCDLRGANFSLSDLRGADLRGADLSGADLEGANLSGANLGDARLVGCAMTATRLHGDGRGANVQGADFTGVVGLLEAQSAWLTAHLS